MPTFSYTVVSSLPPGPSSSSNPVLTPDNGLSVCIPRFFSQQDFLDLFDRIHPFEYIEPMKDPGPGFEVFQMIAKLFERVSLAAGRTECCLFVIFSHGGFRSEGLVEFFRPNAATGAFTLRAGTTVRATDNNREFVLIDDLEFGATDLIKQALVRAKQADFAFDLPGPTDNIEGEVDLVSLPLQEPPFAEPSIAVRQSTDTARGQPACLDLHGKDRSIPRHVNETDDEYRVRVQTLPDTVSPDALIRQLDRIFVPIDFDYDLIETWENRYQSCWDAPTTPIVNPIVGDFNPDLFVYDDPRPNPPFRNRWLDANDHGSGLILVIPNLPAFADKGFVFDDPAVDSDDHDTSLGARAHSAFDIPEDTSLDLTITIPSAVDAGDSEKNGFIKTLFDVLQKIKGGGISLVIELEGQ